jgi:D-beta-D-heptose 7-phosphate kinase/D-beta-D-heptose 1-phosphate adenosyltransferase
MLVLVDLKMRNFLYRPATLVTPNHHEALRMAGLDKDSDAGLPGGQVDSLSSSATQLITRGDRGMMLEGRRPRIRRNSGARGYDVTGAGDTVIATATAPRRSINAEAAALVNQLPVLWSCHGKRNRDGCSYARVGKLRRTT